MPEHEYPPWIVLHVPHEATEIPSDIREQFLLDDRDLLIEITLMTDHFTSGLFATVADSIPIIRSPISRLVVDVERFADDSLEPMAARGMGVIYALTSQLEALRRPLMADEREALISRYYRSHHESLEQAVSQCIAQYGRCLVLDCHSFPSVALPYEMKGAHELRPDICIGTDEFHTSASITQNFETAFRNHGWHVALNHPFSGALVPLSRYRSDKRVAAIMVEVNRKLYMNEQTALPLPSFAAVADAIRGACISAINCI